MYSYSGKSVTEVEMDSVNIVFIGNSQSGKTTLINLLTYEEIAEDYQETTHITSHKLTLHKEKQIVPAIIWDTPGKQALIPVISKCLINADAILFVLDVTRNTVDDLNLFKKILDDNQTEKTKSYAKFIITNKPIDREQLFNFNRSREVAEALGWMPEECKFLNTNPYNGRLFELTLKPSGIENSVYKGSIQEDLPTILYNQLYEKNLLIDTSKLIASQQAKIRLMKERKKQRKYRKDEFIGGVSGATIGMTAGLCFVAYGIYSILLLPVHPLGLGLITFGAIATAVCATILFFLVRKEKIAKKNECLFTVDPEVDSATGDISIFTETTNQNIEENTSPLLSSRFS